MIRGTFRKGLGFGLTSGIITTVGLLVGLYTSTNSKLAVIGGILTVAVADAFSDALGIHIAEEFSAQRTKQEVREITVSTFLFKFFFSAIFIIPIIFLDLFWAIIISVIFGLGMIGFFSYKFAKLQKINPQKAAVEHLIVAIVVVIIAYYIGHLISFIFS